MKIPLCLPRQSDKSKTFNERAFFSILLTKFFDTYRHPKDSFSNWQEAVICTRTSSSLLPEFWHLDKSKCFNWFPFEKFVLPLKKRWVFMRSKGKHKHFVSFYLSWGSKYYVKGSFLLDDFIWLPIHSIFLHNLCYYSFQKKICKLDLKMVASGLPLQS